MGEMAFKCMQQMSELLYGKKPPPIDEWYLALAFVVSCRSKNNDKNGAVLVDPAGQKPLGLGFSGPPPGANDSKIIRGDVAPDLRRALMVHAEVNAIRQARLPHGLANLTMYVTGLPCKRCVVDMRAWGVRRVVHALQPATQMTPDEVRLSCEAMMELEMERVEMAGCSFDWLKERLFRGDD